MIHAVLAVILECKTSRDLNHHIYIYWTLLPGYYLDITVMYHNLWAILRKPSHLKEVGDSASQHLPTKSQDLTYAYGIAGLNIYAYGIVGLNIYAYGIVGLNIYAYGIAGLNI